MTLRRFITVSLAAVLAATGLVATPAFAGGNFRTKTNLNLRECQFIGNIDCYVKTVIPMGATVYLTCWLPGTPVNGNTIWYETTWRGVEGMLAGAHVTTGRDPNPLLNRCG